MAFKPEPRLPVWLKIAFTAWMLVWVPTYARYYGLQNFLWLCDLCNFILAIALWAESPLLFSSQMVAVLIIDILWSVDVAGRLFTGVHFIGGTAYMFSSAIPLLIRIMSLFHVFTPPLLIYAVLRLGYHRRGLLIQTGITWLVLPLSYIFTGPDRNINWVWGPCGQPQSMLEPRVYLLVCMAAYPLLIYLPSHGLVLLICRWHRRRSQRKAPRKN